MRVDDKPTGKRGFDSETERLSFDLSQANRRITELQETVDALADRVADLERVVDPDGTATDYDGLTREQKVFQLRTALVRRAFDNAGRAAMQYGEIQSLFGNRPSPGHAYDLMDHAAEMDGFRIDDTADAKRLTVKTDAVNDETVIHAANNAPDAQPA